MKCVFVIGFKIVLTSSPTDSLPIEFSRFLLTPILFTALSFPVD